MGDSDKEGDKINLYNDEVVTCKKCAALNKFIDEDTFNIDLGNEVEFEEEEERASIRLFLELPLDGRHHNHQIMGRMNSKMMCTF